MRKLRHVARVDKW